MSVDADTIVAIATAPGRGGVGVVRISGPGARSVGGSLFLSSRPDFADFVPYRMHHGRLRDAGGADLDDVLAVFMPGPGSYTGEDVLELHCHGSPAVLEAAVDAAVACGARPARPGEFTKRAFLAGKLDLSQAQAVAELVAAPTVSGARLALARLEGLMGRRVAELRGLLETLRARLCLAVDFPEEEAECLDVRAFLDGLDRVLRGVEELLEAHRRAKPFREGGLVVLAGAVNAGKSSLLNALLGRERAIVSPLPGTTRDYLEESLDLDGVPVRLADTAGLRDTGDPVEAEGSARSRRLAGEADLVLLVVDGSRDFKPEALLAEGAGEGLPRTAGILAVVNKDDLPRPDNDPRPGLEAMGFEVLAVSARTGAGLDDLVRVVRRRLLGKEELPADQAAPNLRERDLLERARCELAALRIDLLAGVPPDLLGVRLESACAHLSDITGEITPGEVLDAIFGTFCVGK